MSDQVSGLLAWASALLAGFALGAVFFGGLWWTVRRAAFSRTPARWFLGSMVLRTAFVLAGFYTVGAGQPAQMGWCLLGFLVARGVVLRVTRPGTGRREPPCA